MKYPFAAQDKSWCTGAQRNSYRVIYHTRFTRIPTTLISSRAKAHFSKYHTDQFVHRLNIMDFSILQRVKSRLYGDVDQSEKVEGANSDTQVIGNMDLKNSLLFAPFHEDPITQTPIETQVVSLSPKPIRLPQLQLDALEFMDLGLPRVDTDTQRLEATQVIAHEETQDAQRRELEADISHATLTDEEHELNAPNTLIDSSVQKVVSTKAELLQIEQNISEQKRLKSIMPGFTKKDTNPLQQLLDAFDSDSDHADAINSETAVRLSPTTSPLLKPQNKRAFSDTDSSESDLEGVNVLDVIDKSLLTQKKKRTPIDDYAEKLKRQLFSSPTKNEVISLDDSDHESQAGELEIPQLTKEQAFLIKHKFSRKHSTNNSLKRKFNTTGLVPHKDTLFSKLRKANAKQILKLREENPDAELMEEIEKEEEEMGNLLEREMERVRRLRKKEKQQEKAKLALLSNNSDDEDADYNGQEIESPQADDSEVPDSDVNSDDYDEADDESSDSDSENQISEGPRVKRARRIVESDEEDDANDISIQPSQNTRDSLAEDTLPLAERNDDSYMFGGPSKTTNGSNSDETVLKIHSDAIGPASDAGSAADEETNFSREDLHQLFLNLPPRRSTQECSILEISESFHDNDQSFQEVPPSQISYDSTNILPTQVDTQPFDLPPSSQNASYVHTQVDHSLGKPILEDQIHEESEEEQNEEEEMKRQVAFYEAKIRRKELKARKMRKEMERRGMKKIVEGEAEESDDEWKGIGGADQEFSDQGDSEDERMIDNNFNIDLNDEEVRKKFMEQYQISDQKELEKLIDDIKNHRLSKRARSNRFDIELSDEEDEMLLAYRRQKLEEQKVRLLDNQKNSLLAKSEKSKAFFESMEEDSQPFILQESESESEETSPATRSQTPTTDENTAPTKSVIRLEEAFVQRQLSFLSKTEEDDYNYHQGLADAQHGLVDDMEDIAGLKQKSFSNLFSRSQSVLDLTEANKAATETLLTDDDEEEDDAFVHVFKKPSIVSSFRSYHESRGAQVSTNSFSGVTLHKQYKAASSSSASITYMSKKNAFKSTIGPTQSIKAKELEEKIHKARATSGIFQKNESFS